MVTNQYSGIGSKGHSLVKFEISKEIIDRKKNNEKPQLEM